MKLIRSIANAVLFVLLPAAVLLKAADAPTATVKGYVLDSACAFYQEPQQTHQQELRNLLRQGWLAAGDSHRRWNH
ncbi:MAG: hypothetical protein DMG39_00260 [Acidobacteria bacterium]|nr:MAG: hypothetical protein DMG39_00260 [Acidobacteriota bacterium]